VNWLIAEVTTGERKIEAINPETLRFAALTRHSSGVFALAFWREFRLSAGGTQSDSLRLYCSEYHGIECRTRHTSLGSVNALFVKIGISLGVIHELLA